MNFLMKKKPFILQGAKTQLVHLRNEGLTERKMRFMTEHSPNDTYTLA